MIVPSMIMAPPAAKSIVSLPAAPGTPSSRVPLISTRPRALTAARSTVPAPWMAVSVVA